MSQQIGWSQESKLLNELKKQIRRLVQVSGGSSATTTTTTTAP